MTKEEFEKIIKPLYLMSDKDCQFMRGALLGNFQKWNEQKQLTIQRVSQQRELLSAFQKNWNKYDDVTKIRNKDIEAHIKGTL